MVPRGSHHNFCRPPTTRFISLLHGPGDRLGLGPVSARQRFTASIIHKTRRNRLSVAIRLSGFDRFFGVLAAESGLPNHLVIDSTCLKTHCIAVRLLKKGSPRRTGRTKECFGGSYKPSATVKVVPL